MVAEYEMKLCVRGYHVYQDIYEAAIGETLFCLREPRNSHDRCAVAVEKSGTVIGQLPRKVSRVSSLLLKRRDFSAHRLENEDTQLIYRGEDWSQVP